MDIGASSTDQLFVLLPPQNFVGSWGHLSSEGRRFIQSLSKLELYETVTFWGYNSQVETAYGSQVIKPVTLRIVDRIPDDGPILVEMESYAASNLHAHIPDLIVAPTTILEAADQQAYPSGSVSQLGGSPGGSPVEFEVVSRQDGSPVSGAVVTIDLGGGLTTEGQTDASGRVLLMMNQPVTHLPRVVIQPSANYWSWMGSKLAINTRPITISLSPLSAIVKDSVQHFYPPPAPLTGSNVLIGVIDSGIGPHPDLSVSGGVNLVIGGTSTDYADNGTGHGTHIAGIIAAQASGHYPARGLCPTAQLMSYRVYGRGQLRVIDYVMAKAIHRAVRDGCDIITLSLTSRYPSWTLRRAVQYAYRNGVLCIAAAGNNTRQHVGFPAAEQPCVAVSAMGRAGTFPPDSFSAEEMGKPVGTDPANFVARSANIGPEISLIAPGVGIVSTVPGGYGEKSGTSMACAVVAARAALVLSANPGLIAMAKGSARADAVAHSLLLNATPLGFGSLYEGQGMP